VLSAEFPGYNGRMQPEDGTVAEYLRANGYSTYALGKWHLTPDAEAGPLGPYERWPLGKGFDHYFGFLGGAEAVVSIGLLADLQVAAGIQAIDGRHVGILPLFRAASGPSWRPHAVRGGHTASDPARRTTSMGMVPARVIDPDAGHVYSTGWCK
jgi:hypothetical protein